MKLIVSLIALVFGATLCLALKFGTAYLKSKNIKRKNLLKNIHQKVFMTAWLGFFFASLYLILTTLAGYFLEKEFLVSLIAYGKGNPGIFFFLGGACFVSVTVLVYIIRIFGKRFYTRWKNLEKTTK